jgi:hypothetical protein
VVAVPHAEQVILVSVREAARLAGSAVPGALHLAGLATLGIVAEVLVVKKHLLAGGEDEGASAIATFYDLIDEFHGLAPVVAHEERRSES